MVVVQLRRDNKKEYEQNSASGNACRASERVSVVNVWSATETRDDLGRSSLRGACLAERHALVCAIHQVEDIAQQRHAAGRAEQHRAPRICERHLARRHRGQVERVTVRVHARRHLGGGEKGGDEGGRGRSGWGGRGGRGGGDGSGCGGGGDAEHREEEEGEVCGARGARHGERGSENKGAREREENRKWVTKWGLKPAGCHARAPRRMNLCARTVSLKNTKGNEPTKNHTVKPTNAHVTPPCNTKPSRAQLPQRFLDVPPRGLNVVER